MREGLVEAATQELVERLGATGRFRVTMGDPINVYLAQEGIKADEFLQGKGVAQAGQRFKFDHLLAVYFKRVQSKPYMEVRFFSLPRVDPAINTAFFVPPTHQAADHGRPVLGGRRARRTPRRPSSDRSWPGSSGAISRRGATRAARAACPCARSLVSPSRCWRWMSPWRPRTRSRGWS